MAHPMAGLAKWLTRQEWQEPLAEVVVEHLGSACADEDVSLDDLEEIIGQDAFVNAWSAACEDFITREIDGGRNVADDYVKRRGWKESPANREFIQALRRSVVSLYEVVEVDPGKSFTLRDLIRGGEPVRVDDSERSRGMRPNELVSARVFRVRQRMRTSEIMLVYTAETAEEIQESLADWTQEAKERAPEIATELGRPDDAALIEELVSPATVLEGAAPLFTDLWLRQVLSDVFDTAPPRIVNSDGDAIELATATYPLAAGVTPGDLDALFGSLACVERAPPHDPVPASGKPSDQDYAGWTVTWHWIDPAADPDPDAEEEAEGEDGIMRLDPRSISGLPVLGDLALREGELRLAANTMNRLERGRALLEPALKGRIGVPVVALRSMADFLMEVLGDQMPDDEAKGA